MPTDTFTSSGTWACPVGVTSADIDCYGGGANGADGIIGAPGDGGGGGAFARKVGLTVTPGVNYSVTVGGVGGDSYFDAGASVKALGGSGTSGGSGGGSTGDTTRSGGDGGAGDLTGTVGGGGGGCAGSSGVGSPGDDGASGGGGGSAGGGSAGSGGAGGNFGAGSAGSAAGGAGGGGGFSASGGAGVGGRVDVTYTVAASPNPTSCTPNTGVTTGGDSVVIAGTNFRASATVTFDGSSATGVSVDSSTQITCITPAHSAGAVDVVVTNSDLTTGTLTAGYTYDSSSPAPSSCSPSRGTTAGGTSVTVSGTHFRSGAGVTFGGSAATSVTVVNSTTITCVTPAHSAGSADVVVTNSDLTTGTLVGEYDYDAPSSPPPPAPPPAPPRGSVMNSVGPGGGPYRPLYDPRSARAERARFSRAVVPALERANHVYCPAGRWPTRGWVLMARSDYDQINRYSTALQLNLGDTAAPGNVGPLKNLSIVQAQCVTRGLASDRNALYLVELTDGRGLLHNEWFSHPTNSAYNVRAPSYPQTFHPSSMNGGTTWTWSTMLQDLWSQVSARLGAWPGLPFAPAGTPEGFWFSGVPVWSALCDVLDHVGMAVACDLQSSSPFTIVRQNAADATHSALLTKYAANLEDDLEWIDVGAGRVPGSVKVFFRRRNSVYGTEETVRYDSPQWDMAAIYSVSASAPAAFSSASGAHHLWSDFTVRYDQEGSPLAADVTAAAAIAQERADQYYARTSPGASTARTYAGALPFKTGSLVDGVCWYRDDVRDGGRAGWRTQVVYGPQPPWPDLWR